MEDNYIQRINSVFNEQLQQQIAGILKPGHVYKLGNPSNHWVGSIDQKMIGGTDPFEQVYSIFFVSDLILTMKDLLHKCSKELSLSLFRLTIHYRVKHVVQCTLEILQILSINRTFVPCFTK